MSADMQGWSCPSGNLDFSSQVRSVLITNNELMLDADPGGKGSIMDIYFHIVMDT